MKANKMSIAVEETGLSVRDGKRMLENIIDKKINNYKIQYITDWEKDHSLCPSTKNQKIERLELTRENLRNFCKAFEGEEGEFSFTLSLDVKFTSKDESGVNETVEEELVNAY